MRVAGRPLDHSSSLARTPFVRTREERRAAALAALEQDPGLRLDELADRLGLEVRRLAPVLWRMEEDGLVVHEARRWYPVLER